MSKSPSLSPSPRAESRGAPAAVVVGLVLLGAALFVASPDWGALPQYGSAALVAAVAVIPAVARRVTWALDGLRRVSRRWPWVPPVVIFLAAFAYFATSAVVAGRSLAPHYHDEFMEQLQAQMLARGRLWMPPHPLGEFFDSFFVVTRPVYASVYFPGTAMMYVPGVWLGLEPWYTSLAIAALAVAMLYCVVAELIDPAAGWVAALLAVALEQLRVIAVMTMSHSAVLLLALATAWAYLRWRRERRWGWLVAVGALAGWAAITRPLDAICLVLPIGVAMLWDLRRAGAKRIGVALGIVTLAATPFLRIQLILDKGVTGHWLRPPIAEYGMRNFPGLFGPRAEATATAESPSPLPQVRDYYRVFLREDLRNHLSAGFLRTWVGQRWASAADVGVPYHILWLLVPVGLLGLRSPGRWAVAVGAVLLPLAYTFYPSYLKHYGLPAAGAFILLVLLGAEELRRRWPGAGAALYVGLAALAVTALPELRGARDRYMEAPFLEDINAKIAQLEHRPAVVLFRYESGRMNPQLVHQEPVYNVETAWPDNAEVVRAHDLGPENRRILAYYAAREPRRFFYRYDRSTAELTPLGWDRDLAATGNDAPPPR